MIELFLVAIMAFALGLVTAPRRTRYIVESEGKAIRRVREKLEKSIAALERRILDPKCSWSEADNLKETISTWRDVLALLPVDPEAHIE